jgi:hypothetical protein
MINPIVVVVIGFVISYHAVWSLDSGMLKGNDTQGYSLIELIPTFLIVYAVMMGIALLSSADIVLVLGAVYAAEIILAVAYIRSEYKHPKVLLAIFLIWAGNLGASYALSGSSALTRAWWQLPLLVCFFIIFVSKRISVSIKKEG